MPNLMGEIFDDMFIAADPTKELEDLTNDMKLRIIHSLKRQNEQMGQSDAT